MRINCSHLIVTLLGHYFSFRIKTAIKFKQLSHKCSFTNYAILIHLQICTKLIVYLIQRL